MNPGINVPRRSEAYCDLLVLLAFGTIMVGSALSQWLTYTFNQNFCISVFLQDCTTIPSSITPSSTGWAGLFNVSGHLVLVPGVGYEVKGATRWVRIGGFSLQAVEVAKFGLMIFLAGYLAHYHDALQQSPNRILYHSPWFLSFAPWSSRSRTWVPLQLC